MADSKTPLEPGNFYHIYNHAVGNEKLFRHSFNYKFFLDRLVKYLDGFVDIYSYCLMPNHFHLLVRVKDFETISATLINSEKRREINSASEVPSMISRQFSHAFNSYAQAYNREFERKGSLFYNRFKRKFVKDETYLKKLVHYIHYNPVESGLLKNVGDWEFSSYREIVSDNRTAIKRKEVIELFEDIGNFKYCHLKGPYEG